MRLIFAAVAAVSMLGCAAAKGEQAKLTVPAGTPLAVRSGSPTSMRVGAPIRGALIYAVYAENQLVLPEGTVVHGTVTALTPDSTTRFHARLRGDFTPFRTPVVHFDSLEMADGSLLPIMTGTATDGAPTYRVVASPPKKGGFVRQQFDNAKSIARDRIAVVTGPDKGDRLKQFFYRQLPVHPQRIERATAWTVETTEPLIVSAGAKSAPVLGESSAEKPPTWIVQAYLAEEMSSGSSNAGDAIRAVVAEPVLNADGSVAVPQGAVLTGMISQTKKSRSFGRAGELRFNFKQLTLPGEEAQSVQTTLTGADLAGDMAMTAEGEIKQKPKDRFVVPLILIALAARPLHHEHGEHEIGRNAAASNSLGFIGFIVGTVARQANVAAGIGFYGAAISIYERIFRRGKEVTFAKDTRVVLQTTPRRSGAMGISRP